jgi:pimeloyl-ACP methyl ester carboxylesterase
MNTMRISGARRGLARRARHGLSILVASLALLLPVAACGSGGLGVGVAVGPVPAPELQKFYAQELTWTGCAPFECAYLEVPLDYSKPDGETARLALLRQKAGQPSQRIGSLVVNPGGPGGTGTDFAAGLATQVENTVVGQRFDIVGFDPRGVGNSEPAIECLTPRDMYATLSDEVVDNSPAGLEQQEADARDYAAKCAQRSGTDLLANVGARDVARDMDILRSALGDPQLTYLGISYGTRLGYTYAEQFPGNVRALVLDGAMDPNQSHADWRVAQAAAFQQAFDTFAAWCATQQPCPLGNDPKVATDNFKKLVLPLVDAPLPLPDGRTLTWGDTVIGTHGALYKPAGWEPLRQALLGLADGNGEGLMQLADAYSSGASGDANTAILCVEDKPLTDPVAALQHSERLIAAAPFMYDDGRGPSAARDVCAFWPVPPTMEAHQPNVAGLPQTLVVSTTGDPATPYQDGVDLATALGATLLTVHGTQHGASLMGDQCVDDVVTRYLTDLELPPDGAQCTLAPVYGGES